MTVPCERRMNPQTVVAYSLGILLFFYSGKAPTRLNIINLRISAAHLNHFIKCLFIAEHVKRKNAHILPLKGVWAF